MEEMLAVLGVLGGLGLFCFALWHWRAYLIGYFAGGGGGPIPETDTGASSSADAIDLPVTSDHDSAGTDVE